jgi:hypothetical protein
MEYVHEVFGYFVENPTRYWYGTAQLTTNPPPSCTLIPKITGSSSMVCTSNCTFTVNNYCPGSTISWSVSSGQLQKVSSSGNTAVFRGLANASGLGIIQATVTPPNGSVSNATYQVWVGTPAISNISGPNYSIVGSSCTYTATLADARANATSYNWSIIPNLNNNFTLVARFAL